jgi:colanic acid biosynthesis glycosyl transferase WcaI
MYSGNLGLSQELSIVLDVAEQLRDRADVTFLFVGEGASKAQLQQETIDRGLTNVRFLPYQPREILMESLSAADLQLLPIRAEALKSLMPSKLYGILASGTAVLSTAPPDTELGRIVELSGAGINVYPYTSSNLTEAVQTLVADRGKLRKMGQQGRHLAEARYDRKLSVQKFVNLLQDVCVHRFPADSSDEAGPPRNMRTEA